jgi:hypothetical protein
MTTSHQRRPVRLLLAAAAIVGLTGVASCGGGSKPHPTAGAVSPVPKGSTTTGATLPKGVTNATAVATNVPNRVSLRKNVQLTSCAKVSDGWEASGVATNPASSETEYTITVFFTTASATVIGTGDTHVQVGPGSSQPWTVTGNFVPAPSTLCVLRGVG